MNNLDDEDLDQWLRRSAELAVPDDGFSARVMRVLPARKPQQGALPYALLVGGLLAGWSLLPSPLLQQALREWQAAAPGASSAVLVLLLFGVGLLSCSWALEEAA